MLSRPSSGLGPQHRQHEPARELAGTMFFSLGAGNAHNPMVNASAHIPEASHSWANIRF